MFFSCVPLFVSILAEVGAGVKRVEETGVEITKENKIRILKKINERTRILGL